MSVATHLGMSPSAYDRKIRGLIPHYDELLCEAADALAAAERPIRRIVDLGMGTGALSAVCLAAVPGARITGIERDAAMAAVARRRLVKVASQVTIRRGDFLQAAIPQCDAIVATYSLHHIKSRREKAAFYGRCAEALRPGGVFISGDCFPPSSVAAYARDVERWVVHLSRAFGGRDNARREFSSWSDEDTYVPLNDEVRMLTRAGLRVDIAWRRSPFAVVVGVK